MMKLFLVLCALLVAFDFGVVAIPFSRFHIPPDTVPSLNTTAYLGRWFQMYTSLIPNVTFERNSYCVTADYLSTTEPDAAFAVINSERIGYVGGELQQVSGFAYGTEAPGKFNIEFKNMSQPGDYWVLAVGPVTDTADGTYPWAVVSTPFLISLFILARDVERFRSTYQVPVLDLAKQKGFTNIFNKPLETFQGSICQYAHAPPTSLPTTASLFLRRNTSS